MAAKNAIDEMDNIAFEGSVISVKPAFNKRKDKNQQTQGDERKRGPMPDDVCNNCKGLGHWANECTQEKSSK